MLVEIRSNGVVFQIRLHWVEGKKHGIHEERFRLYLDSIGNFIFRPSEVPMTQG